MPYFTKYAEEKFNILNKHKVYLTREQIVDCLADKNIVKKGKYYLAKKDGVGVVFDKETGEPRIITFYPVKLNNE